MMLFPSILLIALVLLPSTIEAAFCRQNWISYESKCYRIYELTESNQYAHIFCALRGGRLASLSSKGLVQMLTEELASYSGTYFTVGMKKMYTGTLVWKDGVIGDDQDWISEDMKDRVNRNICPVFDASTGTVVSKDCAGYYGVICLRDKISIDPMELCPRGLTEHSFIGEETGRCIYRLSVSTEKANAHSRCSETGGEYLDFKEILIDGLDMFKEHKVMTNDGINYWTNLTWNGSDVLWEWEEVLQQNFSFIPGTGSCITVVFNFTDQLEINLLQTECTSQAYVICGAALNETFTTRAASEPAPRQQFFCPPGDKWVSYSGSCYYETAMREKLSWEDARSFCKGFGGDLASLHSFREETNALGSASGLYDKPFWVGLKLDPATDTYNWSDGSPLDFENWAPGHPDHKDKRLRCVTINGKSGLWKSAFCGIHSYVVCQAPIRPEEYESVIPTQAPLVACDDDPSSNYIYFQGHCYHILDRRNKWHRARQLCEEEGSSLVSIHSDDEIGFLLRMIHVKGWLGDFWIGLNSLSDGRTGSPADRTFRWTDWSPVDFTNWREGEPNNAGNQEKCSSMHNGNGEWNDEKCDAYHLIICKRPSNDSTVTPDPLLGNCKQGWYTYYDWCYLPRGVVEEDRANWTVASEFCTEEGGYLTSIRSSGEQAVVAYLMKNLKEDTWIGLQNTMESDKYYWADGTEIQYTNWAAGEPSLLGTQENCTKMIYESLNSGAWADDECSKKLPFICKAKKEVACDDDPSSNYTYFEGYCYSVTVQFKSWRAAKKHCENKESSLVSIHSVDEMAFLQRMVNVKAETSDNFWIGLNFLSDGRTGSNRDRTSRWTDWTQVDFTNWDFGEPSYYPNEEKCCSMNKATGRWNDDKCDNQMGFICKRPSKDSTVSPATPDPLLGNCKQGWYTYHDSCYLPRGVVEEDRANWTVASEFCTKEGGYLTSIRNSGQQVFVAYLMQDLKEDTWIGLHDTIESDKYYWADGTGIQYTNWASGEPSLLGTQEKCVKMLYKSLNSGVWVDDECSKKLPFICKMKKDPYLLKPFTDQSKVCFSQYNWLKHGQMCFKMFDDLVTWKDAELACREAGAHLISITDTEVLAIANYISAQVNRNFWIGLQYNGKNQKLSWSNDWPVILSKWGKNQPGHFHKNMCYASTPDGYWEGIPCGKKMPYICQTNEEEPPAVEPPKKGKCPNTSDEWVSTDGNFCLLPTTATFDWSSAFLKCLSYDSHMISLHSLKDLRKLKETINIDVPSVFLGLERNIKGGFMWSDGSPVDYVNWVDGEPKNEEDGCVEMSMDTLKWRVIPCSEKRHSVCMIEKEPYLPDEDIPGPQLNNEIGCAARAENEKYTRIIHDETLRNENEEHKIRTQLLQIQMKQMDTKFNTEMKMMTEKHTLEMFQMKQLHEARMNLLNKKKGIIIY